MSNQPVIQLRNVTKQIGKKTIINDISFDVPRGEVFGFLGPNGAGKTTTIRMIVGLMSVTKGDILIEGKSIITQFEQAIRHVGAIVENPEMYKYLTGYQNLIHYARMVPGITNERIDEVIELVGLNKRINDKVKTYSLGMRQRLGVAQAVLHKPSLLVLDEPTNGLDPAGIRELRDYLRNLAKDEGIAVFVSSHLLSEMELMCDRVAIIQNGRMIDVKQLKGENALERTTVYIFEVDAPDKAIEALQATHPEMIPTASDGAITLEITKEAVPDVSVCLMNAGVKVYGVKEETKSLEDQFLEVTGGEGIV